MNSKRVKISFDSINEGKYTIIDGKSIYEANKKIKKHMEVFLRNFKKKQAQ